MYGGTDNLYKFMLICGMLLISLATIFPLQKKQLLEIEKNTCQEQATILKTHIDVLDSKVNNLLSEKKELNVVIDSLSKDKKNIVLLAEKKKKYNKKISELRGEFNNLKIKQVMLDYQIKKINILDSHIDSYTKYNFIMIFVGIILSIIGLSKWWRRSRLQDKSMS